ncbi:hypothetical protein QTO34_006290 [Cnephaeus nilssonii]|uniref:Uncharacterized protein n=1 Tax=Cnephaeus nilssonii TaxID=3371016 RepID=A0AA40LHK8_CNENI|nr:hypothetical protein QTO34_006290 [Eptesicus nilssonii]
MRISRLLRPAHLGTPLGTRCPWGGFPGRSCLPGRTGGPAAPCGLWSSPACSARCSSAPPSSPWKEEGTPGLLPSPGKASPAVPKFLILP